ncbi:MAG: glutamyl-tRNA reductase [Roseburia sp.]|nr:glutamyl-tRNA reductase [Roseburia sp.]MCM1280090.1 glutamyl-tRNA reductase [Robinsoniella sp.]
MNCISISYRNTPLKIRECCAFSMEEKKCFEKKVLLLGITGCVLVSTCNRIEIYFTGENRLIPRVERLFLQEKQIEEALFKKSICIYSGEGTLRHLMKVSCGMDSMVLGEDEILRQVKEAYQASMEEGCCDYECNLVFQEAFHVAKAIKTDTRLSKTPISIGTLAAHAVIAFLEEAERGMRGSVLLVGVTGKIGGIVAKNLLEKEEICLLLTSRSHNQEQELFSRAKNADFVPYEKRYEYLNQADVIISATKSPHYTFTKDETEQAIKSGKSRLFLDLAVPCDIDGEIGKLPDTRIMNIDDFKILSEKNNAVKLKELEKAQIYMEEGLEEIKKALSYHELQKNVAALQELADKKGISHVLYQLRDRLTGDEIHALVKGLNEIAGEN